MCRFFVHLCHVDIHTPQVKKLNVLLCQENVYKMYTFPKSVWSKSIYTVEDNLCHMIDEDELIQNYLHQSKPMVREICRGNSKCKRVTFAV